MKKIAPLLFIFIFLVGCVDEGIDNSKTTNNTSSEISSEESTSIAESSTTQEDELDFKVEAENNAKEYPASAGKILYDKKDNKFKGMNYFFEGEIIGDIKLNNVTSGEAWLVKNSDGYVMPVEYDYFKANQGDNVKIWGTLSGLQFSSSDLGVENVVGATGSMHAMSVEVNGETQY